MLEIKRTEEISSLVLFTFFLCVFSGKAQGDLGDLKEGQKIPAFEVGSYKSTADDGKPRVILFFRADNDISKKCLHALEVISSKFSPRGVSFVAIANEEPALLQDIAKKFNLTFPVLADQERNAFNSFEIYVLPGTYIVDKNGILVRYISVFPNNYVQLVDRHLAWMCGDISKEEMEKSLNDKHVQAMTEKAKKEIYNFNMVRRLWDKGKKSVAMSTLQKLQKEYPDFFPFFLQPGNWELAEKRYDKALALFQELKKKMPKEPDPILGIAITYRMMGKAKEAQSALKEYEKAGGKKYRLFYEQARLNSKQEAQRDFYKKAIESMQHKIGEGEAKDLYVKGQKAEKDGNLAISIQHYRNSLEKVFYREIISVPDPLQDTHKTEESGVSKPHDPKDPKKKEATKNN